MMTGATFSLTLPSEPRMLSVARGFVEAVCEAQQLDRATTHALLIVTVEAVTNIFRHAHRDRPTAQFELHLDIQTDLVVLMFRDEGAPFDFAAVPELPPGELRIGGRGVYLMRTLMDEVCSDRCEPDRPGNVLRLTKRRTTKDLGLACG